MSRILIGWELGANQGHVLRMLQIARPLAEEGHEIGLAVQNLAGIPLESLASFEVFQAPVWPRLLANMARRGGVATNSLGDILVRLGLDEPATLPRLMAGWQGIFAAFAPDLVIADFAPALLRAASGRIPTLQIGTGFTLPPSDMECFPSLTGTPPIYDEMKLLEAVNAALAHAGFARLNALPELFGADADLPGTFAELDPYAEWRSMGHAIPSTAAPVPEAGAGNGEEIFVYGFEQAMAVPELWKGLHQTGRKIRLHLPRISPQSAKELETMGMIVERNPLPFADITRRSRIVLSHGGHGFVCSAMLAGLPQVITHYDLEKHCHAAAVARLGLGGHASIRTIKAEPLARSIGTFYESEPAQQKARAMAQQLGPRMHMTMEAQIAATAERLLD